MINPIDTFPTNQSKKTIFQLMHPKTNRIVIHPRTIVVVNTNGPHSFHNNARSRIHRTKVI